VTRLVIADDNPAMRRLIRTVLADRFDEITEAADGRELFWTLVHAAYDDTDADLTVIADICMPIYSGLDVAAVCDDLGVRVPTVLITSFPSDELRASVERLGYTLIAKPFTTAKLREVVDAVSA
jgi:two-component system KDP operon response regulator KdpE